MPVEPCSPFGVGVAKGQAQATPAPVEAGQGKKQSEPNPPSAASGTMDLRLRFELGRTDWYRSAQESFRTVQWEGLPAGSAERVVQGRTSNRVEVLFEQKVTAVEPNGQASLKVTLRKVMLASQVAGVPSMQFDSSQRGDPNRVLKRIVGRSYQITLTPNGQVAALDTTKAREGLDAVPSPDVQAALNVLSDEAIKDRHRVPALVSGAKMRRVRESWSDFEVVPFDRMGSRSFEKVYQITSVSSRAGRTLATVQLTAVPSSQGAQEMHKAGPAPFADRSGTDFTYTGETVLDVGQGAVDRAVERLEVVWVVAGFGQVDVNGVQEPTRATMTAGRSYEFERITTDRP